MRTFFVDFNSINGIDDISMHAMELIMMEWLTCNGLLMAEMASSTDLSVLIFSKDILWKWKWWGGSVTRRPAEPFFHVLGRLKKTKTFGWHLPSLSGPFFTQFLPFLCLSTWFKSHGIAYITTQIKKGAKKWVPMHKLHYNECTPSCFLTLFFCWSLSFFLSFLGW